MPRRQVPVETQRFSKQGRRLREPALAAHGVAELRVVFGVIRVEAYGLAERLLRHLEHACDVRVGVRDREKPVVVRMEIHAVRNARGREIPARCQPETSFGTTIPRSPACTSSQGADGPVAASRIGRTAATRA